MLCNQRKRRKSKILTSSYLSESQNDGSDNRSLGNHVIQKTLLLHFTGDPTIHITVSYSEHPPQTANPSQVY